MDDLCIITHVGVGKRSTKSVERLRSLLEESVRRGRGVASGGGGASAIDIVRECIRTLEESPLTNAGLGSNVNRDCQVECDASIIDGSSGKGASVAAVPSVMHAIDIAHSLAMLEGPACMAGVGALKWFREHGGTAEEVDLITDAQRKMHRKYSTNVGELNSTEDIAFDTVGAVVLFKGQISAGVSSGGTFLKPPGRVGQAGVYGAGCWADSASGVSTSGTGEHLIKTLIASRCVQELSSQSMESEPPVMKLQDFLEKSFVKSSCVQRSGHCGAAAGVVGLVHDADSRVCDILWAHTTANFMIAYSVPGRDRVSVKVCPQSDIDDIEKVKVYASGKTVRLK